MASPAWAADRPLDPASCGACHHDEWRQWQGSRHAVAASNEVFTASWDHWPNGWCLSCHAPGRQQQIDRLGGPARMGFIHSPPVQAPGDSWRHGVDCAACHVQDGVVMASREPSALAVDMHPIRHEPTLGDERLCARCHEFTLQNHTPPAPFTYGDTPAQATITQWRSSTAAARGTGCTDCHMGAAGHGFPGAHTPELVRGAIDVDVRLQAGEVVLTLSTDTPHVVPTGDPFRRIEVRLCADEACTEPLAEHVLRRVLVPNATTWDVVHDRRIPTEGSREVRLPLHERAQWWRLDYRFGDKTFEPQLPAHAVGYLIASGRLPRESP